MQICTQWNECRVNGDGPRVTLVRPICVVPLPDAWEGRYDSFRRSASRTTQVFEYVDIVDVGVGQLSQDRPSIRDRSNIKASVLRRRK